MKQRILPVLFILITFLTQSVYSQKLTLGFQNGTCYSDPHGNFTTGTWKSKAGPVSSLFINYSLNRHLSFQTELNYTNQYYTNTSYNNINYGGYQYLQNSMIISSSSVTSKWDVGFYRIPLFATLTAGTNLKIGISAGGYISILANHEGVLPYYSIYPDMFNKLAYYPVYYSDLNLPKFDYGLLYAASLSYPISGHFRANLSGRYFIGKKVYLDYQNIHLGALEWTFGLAYSVFSKKNKPVSPLESVTDTAIHRLSLQALAGYSLSWNGGENNQKSYRSKSSVTAGISMSYMLDKSFSLRMDALIQRRGYLMKDSSSSFFRYAPANYTIYKTDNRIDLDYVVIPLLLKVKLGGPLSIYLNAGPYVGMLLNARVTGTAYNKIADQSNYSTYKTTVSDNIEGYLKPSDWGWVYGGGMKIPLFKKYALDVEIRYEKGSTNVFDASKLNDQPNSTADKTLYNESLSLMVGMIIPL